MSRKNKLQRFAETLQMSNIFQSFDPLSDKVQHATLGSLSTKGRWNELYFKNKNPICLELACGKGEYSVELAGRYPKTNFVGVDIKGARLWKGAKIGLEKGLNNLAFLRIRIEQISRYFGPNEVNELWITFPDPFLKKENRRLTAPYFLDQYRKIGTPGMIAHLKTDDQTLYESTLEVLSDYPHAKLLEHFVDIYSLEHLPHPELDIKTYYETIHLQAAKKIKYIRFKIL